MPVQKILNNNENSIVKIWTNDIEEEAIKQLLDLSKLPFIYKYIAVMPDVHAGKGSTVGTVIATDGAIIPSCVGADLSCGMMAARVNIDIELIKSKLSEIRHSIERSIPTGFYGNKTITEEIKNLDIWKSFDWYEQHQNKSNNILEDTMSKLCSLGSGNHYIELCLDTENGFWVMLHTGSRNIGARVGQYYAKKAKELCDTWKISLPNSDLAYLPKDTVEYNEYMKQLDWCGKYANENRRQIMKRVLKDLSYTVNDKKEIEKTFEVECVHNYISIENHFGKNVLITRKGAIRVNEDEFGIIPGSMGAKSYIVKGLGNKESFCSASHGAGRKMSRTKAKELFTIEDLKKQTDGVECRKDKDVVDEIPSAYKSIDEVMENQSDLVEPVFQLKQILCIKG